MNQEIIISETNLAKFCIEFQKAVIRGYRVIEHGFETPNAMFNVFWAKLLYTDNAQDCVDESEQEVKETKKRAFNPSYVDKNDPNVGAARRPRKQ